MARVVLSPTGRRTCAWTQGSRKFAIYVHPDVLTRLEMDIKVAFKRVPRRGLEIGGILLGRTKYDADATTFGIEGFQSIDSEHRSGPSYILSPSDIALFGEALTKNGGASIGIYRSQTRSQQLVLQEPDVQLFQRCFDAGGLLFLMACPLSGRAAFFFREDAELKCVCEFDLASPIAPSLTFNQPLPEIQSADVAVSEPVDPTPPLRKYSPGSVMKGKSGEEYSSFPLGFGIGHRLLRWARRGSRVKTEVWLVGAMIVSVVLGAGIGMLTHPPASSNDSQRLKADLQLTVERTGGLLRVFWDPHSLTMRDPLRAVLHIQDGNYRIDRTLVLSELRAGNVTYEPKSREVIFSMDVSSPTANATGSVQVVNLSPQPPIAQTRPAETLQEQLPGYSRPESSRSKTSALTLAAPPVPRVRDTEDTQPSALGSVERTEAAPVVRPESAPALDTATEARSSVVEGAGIPRSVQGPFVRVSIELIAGSRFERLLGKVPLVRRLRKPVKILGPGAIFQAQPILTDLAKQSITRPVSVDVKVNVSESGVVEDAEVIDVGDPLSEELANSALAAARRWTFEPARAEELKVPSKVILHFHFTP